MKLVVLGLSLSSSWGNGHATTFRALLKSFARRGHEILFLERDVPWYASQRDLTNPDWCRLEFYADLPGLDRWRDEIAQADAVGPAIAPWRAANLETNVETGTATAPATFNAL